MNATDIIKAYKKSNIEKKELLKIIKENTEYFADKTIKGIINNVGTLNGDIDTYEFSTDWYYPLKAEKKDIPVKYEDKTYLLNDENIYAIGLEKKEEVYITELIDFLYLKEVLENKYFIAHRDVGRGKNCELFFRYLFSINSTYIN